MIADRVASEPVKVLIVEDSPVDADLELRELQRAGIPVEHRVAEDESGLRSILQNFKPDVILCDLSLGSLSGVKAIRIAHELDPNVPAIIVTGSVTEQQAVLAMHSGAVDYVLKTNLQRLGVAVIRAVEDALQKKQHAVLKWRLDQAREQLSNIAETVDSVLSSYSIPHRQFTYVSTIAERVYGHKAQAFLSNPDLWKDIIVPADRAAVRAATKRVFIDDHYDIDYRIDHPSGEQRWVSHRARMSRDGAGEPVRIDSVVIDITQRMEAQHRLRRLSRIRDVMSSFNAAVLRIREREELCHEACRIAFEAGGFVNVFIATIDPETKELMVPAVQGNWANRLTELESSLRTSALIENNSATPLRTVLATGRPTLVNDLREQPNEEIYQRLTEQGVGAIGIFPLMVEGELLGVMTFDTDEAGYFDDEEIQLLTDLVNNLSFALDLLDKQRRVDYLSYYDALTSLPNRALFYNRLDQEITAAAKANKSLVLALLDVSRFSMLNNTLGEHVGDEVLRRIADRLRASADESRIARVAGDRFALCFPLLDDLQPVTEVITEDGIRFLDAPIVLADRELHIMMRAGCAVFPGDGQGAEALFQNAEAALLKAKASGTTYCFYAPEHNARLAKQLDLEARLQRAIEERQFILYYQPKIEVGSRRVIGFEALIRWQDPERGLVSPGDFIPLLERTGIIVTVGRWALGEAVRQFEEWRAAGLKPPRIAVNLSAVQLLQDRLIDDVRSAVASFSAECGLDLEVTESMLMENFDASITKLNAIRELGVDLSLDDFGTGYSSLAYLHRLPLTALKIDRSFIDGMTEDANKTSIVSTIISLAQALQLKVIAEGVETEDQLRLLQLLRCNHIQGYLTGRPSPADVAAGFLKAQESIP